MKSVPGNVLPTSYGFPSRGKHPPKQKMILLFFLRHGSKCNTSNIFTQCTSAPAPHGLGELQQVLLGWMLGVASWRSPSQNKKEPVALNTPLLFGFPELFPWCRGLQAASILHYPNRNPSVIPVTVLPFPIPGSVTKTQTHWRVRLSFLGTDLRQKKVISKNIRSFGI